MDYLVFYIIGGIAIISLIGWLLERYEKARNDRRQKNLDQIAYDILSGFDFNEEKEEIKSIGSRHVSEQYRCPKCNGVLVKRIGRYGEFLGCNHYPDCEYTRSIQK